MLILNILLGLFDQISKVNSAWRIAAFTVTAILLLVRYSVNIKKGSAADRIILVAVFLMFLTGLAPIIASKIIPGSGKNISYKIITELRDSSSLLYNATDIILDNSLNKPVSHVDNKWEFDFSNEDLTTDSLVTISAQTTNKLLWGSTAVRITKSLNYSATIILKGKPIIVLPPSPPPKKTFSLNFASAALIKKIAGQTGFLNTDKSAAFKITVSYDQSNIKFDASANTYRLDACYPIITINGATCATVHCCKIEETGWVVNKSIITDYVNDRLIGSAEQCYQEQITSIIACLKREK